MAPKSKNKLHKRVSVKRLSKFRDDLYKITLFGYAITRMGIKSSTILTLEADRYMGVVNHLLINNSNKFYVVF